MRGFFVEIVEEIVTRDTPFDLADGSWGTYREQPPGRGWRIDQRHDRERSSVWIRRRAFPVVHPVHRRNGGWQS